jgi:UPF0716 protein FxsA
MAAGLIFVVFPLIEILVLIKAGETIGFWPTIGLLFAAAVLGIVVIREQEMRRRKCCHPSAWRRV